jgi:hypothetical protein
MNVIFLDIDGVLNSEYYNHTELVNRKKRGYGGFFQIGEEATKDNVIWDPQCVRTLAYIVVRTDAKIVISSTWREHHPLHRFHEMFALYGVEFDLIGMTQIAAGRWEPYSDNYAQDFRGDEVNAWIAEKAFDGNHVILDDGADFYKDQPLIQTNPDVGLTFNDADAAVRKLTGRYEQ